MISVMNRRKIGSLVWVGSERQFINHRSASRHKAGSKNFPTLHPAVPTHCHWLEQNYNSSISGAAPAAGLSAGQHSLGEQNSNRLVALPRSFSQGVHAGIELAQGRDAFP